MRSMLMIALTALALIACHGASPTQRMDDAMATMQRSVRLLLEPRQGGLAVTPDHGARKGGSVVRDDDPSAQMLLDMGSGFGGLEKTNAWAIDWSTEEPHISPREKFLRDEKRSRQRHTEKVIEADKNDAMERAKVEEEKARLVANQLAPLASVKGEIPPEFRQGEDKALLVPPRPSIYKRQSSESPVSTAATAHEDSVVYVSKKEQEEVGGSENVSPSTAAPINLAQKPMEKVVGAPVGDTIKLSGEPRSAVASKGVTLKEQKKEFALRDSKTAESVTHELAESGPTAAIPSVEIDGTVTAGTPPQLKASTPSAIETTYTPPVSIWNDGVLSPLPVEGTGRASRRTGHCSLVGDALAYEFDHSLADALRFTVEMHVRVDAWAEGVTLFRQKGVVTVATTVNSSMAAIFSNPILSVTTECGSRTLEARFDTGTYHHVTVTASAGSVAVYVDGQLSDTAMCSGNSKAAAAGQGGSNARSSSGKKAAIGGNVKETYSAGHMDVTFEATMDTVRLWNKGMGAREVERAAGIATRDIPVSDLPDLAAAAFPHPTIPHFPSQFSFAEVESVLVTQDGGK